MIRKQVLFLLLAVFSMGKSTGATFKDPIKIACIGNSITYGAKVANRENNAYPEQLQAMLGNQYQVRNFGVSGKPRPIPVRWSLSQMSFL